MNVLSRGIVPKVMGLGDVLKEWLAHRREVLVRRSKFRLDEIDRRLEVLGGYLIAYLNIDKVIKIIRTEDEPKPVLMKTFKLTDVQAEAILNMRLRALRKLEEFEIRTENDKLTKERKEIGRAAEVRGASSGTGSPTRSKRSARPSARTRRSVGAAPTFADAPTHDVEEMQEAMVEREPITVVVSEKGWIRAMKGHAVDVAKLEFKTGDRLFTAFPAETTDKILVFSTKGRFYTLAGDKLPGGRGQGEPIRLMVDMDEGEDIVAAFVSKVDRKLLVASTIARGFIVVRGRRDREHPQGQAGAEPRCDRRGEGLRGGGRRSGCHRRREPEDADLPARSGAGDAAWARACACSATRTAGCPTRVCSPAKTG